jgi:S1-C subfamily serine protease
VTRPRRRAAVAAGLVLAVGAVVVATRPGDGVAAMPTVVTVSAPAATGAADVATGFAVGPDRVVTVAHVIDPHRRLLVRAERGRVHLARVLRIDQSDDLALLAVPGLAARPPRTVSGGVSSARVLVRRNGRVVAMAAAIRRSVTAHISGPGSGPYVRPALELAAAVAVGDSGAPVVDAHGAVTGIVFARSDDHPATAYAVDARALAAVRP